MNPPKVNERWRVALAGLVAALAIPFLVIESPAPAEGVETSDQVAIAISTTTTTTLQADGEPDEREIGVLVVRDEFGPDISRLADQAGAWNVARGQAVADGLIDANSAPPPSNTNLRLLPVVTPAPEPDPVVEEAEPETTTDPEEDPVVEPAPDVEDPDPAAEPEPDVSEAEPELEPDVPEETDPGDGAEPIDPEPVVDEPEPEPEPDPVVEEEPEPTGPRAPAQVNGRVPPPNGGPTAAQWDAVRKCESTHNYRAISPSGLYRGAYQFSQQTWDWVAGIHQPHLVGIDPIDAEPAWQDVMAYTLYAMRGWDQWPICGKNLL